MHTQWLMQNGATLHTSSIILDFPMEPLVHMQFRISAHIITLMDGHGHPMWVLAPAISKEASLTYNVQGHGYPTVGLTED